DAEVSVFPSPDRLLAAREIPGAGGEKGERLRAVARAAKEGILDADTLRAMPWDAAHARIRLVRGLGEWGANHVLYRAVGLPDEITMEPRFVAALMGLYALDRTPDEAAVARILEPWRPFRTWCVRSEERRVGKEGGSRG